MDFILQRRSVRQFEKAEMTKEDVEKILLAGQSAPSGCGKYPMEYIVLQKQEDLDWVAQNHPYSRFTDKAALCVIVCIVPSKAADFGSQMTFATIDAGAACENMILAARVLGYESTWTAIYPNKQIEEPFVKHFKIPEGCIPIAGISFGHKSPECHIAPVDKHKPEQIHYNTW